MSQDTTHPAPQLATTLVCGCCLDPLPVQSAGWVDGSAGFDPLSMKIWISPCARCLEAAKRSDDAAAFEREARKMIRDHIALRGPGGAARVADNIFLLLAQEVAADMKAEQCASEPGTEGGRS